MLVTGLQGQLPRRLLQVAEFALRHPEEMALGTAASIAARVQVQPSTMVRFAQALGYQGFSDLQDVFKARIRDRWPEPPERLKRLKSGPGDSPNSDLDGFIAAAQSSLGALAGDDARRRDRRRRRRLLSRARTVFVIGTRRSFPIVDYLGYTFATLGVRALPIDSMSGLARERAALAEPEDAMLAVSFTPYAPDHGGACRRGGQARRAARRHHRQPARAARPDRARGDRDRRGRLCRLPLARRELRRRQCADGGDGRAPAGRHDGGRTTGAPVRALSVAASARICALRASSPGGSASPFVG